VIIWADHSYKGGWGPKRQLRRLDEWVWEELWCLLEVVERVKDESGEVIKGFHPLPKRWVIERTFAWLYKYRRLSNSKDYEFTPASAAALIYLASVHLLLRRLS
jgi:putative transposase